MYSTIEDLLDFVLFLSIDDYWWRRRDLLTWEWIVAGGVEQQHMEDGVYFHSVWLNAKNIRTSRPSRKLDNKRLGPFTVDTAIGTHAYRLLLPDTMKVHPVFHVSLLDPARPDPRVARASNFPATADSPISTSNL